MPSSTPETSQKLASLLEHTHTLSLATLNDRQLPEASLTPFIYSGNALWVFVSRLSSHTDNLLRQPSVSVLIASDSKPNPFTVERLTIECEAQERTDDLEDILGKMTQKLGETVELLRQLPDFHLFALTPKKGRLILGFGQAFDVDFSDLSLRHINPVK